ncbi:MAG: hypothetical protein ABIN67_24690 [Ferruginibacter sp.]
MKYLFNIFLLCLACFTFKSCNTATPENYFDQAVLNTNMLVGFAGSGMARELESPSVKMEEGTGKAVPMKRKEVVNDRIKYLEESLGKIKDLKETPDTKEMLQSSLALYEYVLPVYKKEYVQLAALYDEGADKEKIQSQLQGINDKYYSKFNELMDKLINTGKSYAERHSIKVNWGVGGGQ